ncbi:MAG: hypothetical protein ACKO7W_11915 [Elainella sp.]
MTFSWQEPPNISLHHKQYWIANTATKFCPTCKPVPESLFDEIYLIAFAEGKTPVTKRKIVWLDSPIPQKSASEKSGAN